MRRGLPLLLVALALIPLASACRGSDESAPSGPPVSTLTVTLKDSLYKPDNVAISAGQTVTWFWDDGSVPHDVKSTSSQEKYGSKLQTSGTFSHTFRRPGRFAYFCSLHPQMRGVVHVS
jgi:plastocyanin